MNHLRVWGCKAHVLIPGEIRTNGQPKTREVIFIGYFEHSRAWKLYDPIDQKIIKSRDVIFEEGEIVEHLRSPDFVGNEEDVEVMPMTIPNPPRDPTTPAPSEQDAYRPHPNPNPLLRDLSPLTDISEVVDEQTTARAPASGALNREGHAKSCKYVG